MTGVASLYDCYEYRKDGTSQDGKKDGTWIKLKCTQNRQKAVNSPTNEDDVMQLFLEKYRLDPNDDEEGGENGRLSDANISLMRNICLMRTSL